MTVRVKFFANVRQLMGKDELILNLDPSKTYNIRDILREVTQSENKDLSTMLLEVDGKSRGAVRILVNGEQIHSLIGLDTTIDDGAQITIFPLLGGG